MKAVVMEGPKLPLEVRDMPVPGVGPRDVLISGWMGAPRSRGTGMPAGSAVNPHPPRRSGRPR